jgi:hypothetical protein
MSNYYKLACFTIARKFRIEIDFRSPFIKFDTAYLLSLQFFASFDKKGLASVELPVIAFVFVWGDQLEQRLRMDAMVKAERLAKIPTT